MYALGIPNRQYRRCTQVLGHENAEPITYNSSQQDDGFWLFTFPEADEYEFEDIVNLLKRNGITTIGADTQLTEKHIMKLTDLLKEQGSPDENELIDILKRTLDSWEKPTYRGGIDSCERSDHYFEDVRDIVEDYEEEAVMDSPSPSEMPKASWEDKAKNLKEDDVEAKSYMLQERFQKLAGIKPIYEQDNFDSRLAQQMGMSDDEFEDQIASRDIGDTSPFMDDDDPRSPGEELADRTIADFRKKYRGMSDDDLDDFSAKMVEHLLDNIAAQARAKVYFAKKGI